MQLTWTNLVSKYWQDTQRILDFRFFFSIDVWFQQRFDVENSRYKWLLFVFGCTPIRRWLLDSVKSDVSCMSECRLQSSDRLSSWLDVGYLCSFPYFRSVSYCFHSVFLFIYFSPFISFVVLSGPIDVLLRLFPSPWISFVIIDISVSIFSVSRLPSDFHYFSVRFQNTISDFLVSHFNLSWIRIEVTLEVTLDIQFLIPQNPLCFLFKYR